MTVAIFTKLTASRMLYVYSHKVLILHEASCLTKYNAFIHLKQKTNVLQEFALVTISRYTPLLAKHPCEYYAVE